MYRKNVAIVVYDSVKKACLVCMRSNVHGAWQFPQGGVDGNESLIEAAKRELFEEVGITSESFSSQNNVYNFDVNVHCVSDIEQIYIEQTQTSHQSISDRSNECVQFIKAVGPYRYDYPTFVKRKEKGQEQTWFLARLKKAPQIRLNYEFAHHDWWDAKRVVDNIVDFKKNVYLQALQDLELI